jgi:hypothetical protein
MVSGFMRGLVVAVGLTVGLPAGELTTEGTRFVRDGKQFEYAGLSFFNAIYNPAFNGTQEARLAWLRKFREYGINVLRVWCQWDNKRGFVDSCPACTLYREDGSLRAERVAVLKEILRDAERSGVVIELVLFSQESWREGIRLSEASMERAVRELAAEMRPHRNLTIQIWNEFTQHTVALAKIVKQADPTRLVTSSPGFAGVPDPEFSAYHRVVFEFLKAGARYRP